MAEILPEIVIEIFAALSIALLIILSVKHTILK